MTEQHNDHVWVTVNGEAWAIMAIQHYGDIIIFHLWRGYEPNLEFCCFEVINPDWDAYCSAAVQMLYEHHGGT